MQRYIYTKNGFLFYIHTQQISCKINLKDYRRVMLALVNPHLPIPALSNKHSNILLDSNDCLHNIFQCYLIPFFR